MRCGSHANTMSHYFLGMGWILLPAICLDGVAGVGGSPPVVVRRFLIGFAHRLVVGEAALALP